MSVDLRPSYIFTCNFHPETGTGDENAAISSVAEDSMGPAILGLWGVGGIVYGQSKWIVGRRIQSEAVGTVAKNLMVQPFTHVSTD